MALQNAESYNLMDLRYLFKLIKNTYMMFTFDIFCNIIHNMDELFVFNNNLHELIYNFSYYIS